MPTWRGCEIPADRYYDIGRDVWVRRDANGEVTLGMTDPAQSRCGKVVHIHFKKVGRRLERGKSAATIESAKWAGPFPTPLSGTIVAVNAEAFREDVLIANRDPYGAGWIVRLEPDNWDDESGELVWGDVAFQQYKDRIEEQEVTCMRCAD